MSAAAVWRDEKGQAVYGITQEDIREVSVAATLARDAASASRPRMNPRVLSHYVPMQATQVKQPFHRSQEQS
jgi:hypothetical protein